jgi:predicted MFS family arabinose efflux permease
VVPLVATAALMAGGGIAYCRTGAARQSRPSEEDLERLRSARPLRGVDGRRPTGVASTALTASGVAALLLVMLALSVGFGQLDTSLAATAGALLGGTQNVGLLFAAIAGGSTVGGLVFGARTWPFDERQAVPVLLAVFAALLGVMAVLMSLPAASLWIVLPLLFVTGGTIAPTLIMQQALLDHLAPSHRLNEAQSFLSASNTTGAAAGTALAGILIDFHGLDWSFGGAAIAAGLAALMAITSQRHWRSAVGAVDAGPGSAAPTTGVEQAQA